MLTLASRCATSPRKLWKVLRRAVWTGTCITSVFGAWGALAAALEPPSNARVLTSVSGDGTFVIDFGGQACSRRDQLSISIDQTPVQRVAQAGCALAFSPAQPLAIGKYCVTLKADFYVDFKETCFEVTGLRPEPSAAGVEIGLTTTPDGLADANCEPCAGLSTGACTRWNPTRYVAATLRAPPELASRHAFALLQRIGSTPPVPEEIDFGLYGSRIGHSLLLVQREVGAPLCVTAFARAFGTSVVQTIGDACTPAVQPYSVPASFRELDCAGYEQRWCTDNRRDCEADLSLVGCASYAHVCKGAPATDASGQTAAAPMTSDDAAMSDAEELAPSASPGVSSRRSGCQLGRSRASDGVVALLLALGPALRLRRRPT